MNIITNMVNENLNYFKICFFRKDLRIYISLTEMKIKNIINLMKQLLTQDLKDKSKAIINAVSNFSISLRSNKGIHNVPIFSY